MPPFEIPSGVIIDDIVQLQSGYRIKVQDVIPQEDGTFLGTGVEQVLGLIPFWYRGLKQVKIIFDEEGRYQGLVDS